MGKTTKTMRHIMAHTNLFYFLTFSLMNTEIILHAPEFVNEREFIESEISKNLTGKLDTYLKKFVKTGEKMRLEMRVTRSKQGISGKIHLVLPGHAFHTERENFSKLDDLISHLFTHLKDQLAR